MIPAIILEKGKGSCNFGRIESESSLETTQKTSEKMTEKILQLLSEKPRLSAKYIAEIMNKSQRTIEREINK